MPGSLSLHMSVPGWAVTLQQSWGLCGRVKAREIEGFPKNASTQGTAQ